MAWRIVLAAFLALAALPGMAQVMRCVDDTSKRVTYSDAACPPGTSVWLIEKRKSFEQIDFERREADRAQQRFDAQQAREIAQEDRAYELAKRRAIDQAAVINRPNQFECERAMRNADTTASSRTARASRNAIASRDMNMKCFGTQEAGRIERARASAPTVIIKSPSITHCVGKYCYDSRGQAHFVPNR